MILHSRIIKPTFWTDIDLTWEFTRDERLFYIGLWQLADDSGCLEDEPRSFKILIFPSDQDITLEILQQWRDHLIQFGKLIPYEVYGKKCLYMKNFHKHQLLRSPNPPEVPLPEWIEWMPPEEKGRTGHYQVRTDFLPTPYQAPMNPVPGSYGAYSYSELDSKTEKERGMGETKKMSAEAESRSADEQPKNLNSKKEIQEIMDFYNHQFKELWKRPLSLTKEREAHIRQRLAKFAVDELKTAIVNLRASPFHCGKNDKGLVYGTPEFLFRNDTQVDKWLKEKTMKGDVDNDRTRTSQKPDRRPLTAEDYDEPEYRDLIRANDRKLEKRGIMPKMPSGDQELPRNL